MEGTRGREEDWGRLLEHEVGMGMECAGGDRENRKTTPENMMNLGRSARLWRTRPHCWKIQ